MANAQVTVALTKIDKHIVGHQALSLTNFSDNVNLPAIAAGGKVDIAGSLFDVTADEAITGWAGIANNTQVYIMLTVSGSSFAASFVTAAPTWDTAKQGWYSGLNRYIGGLYKDGSGNYTKKFLYRASSGGVQNLREYGDGTIEILGAFTVDGAVIFAGSTAFAQAPTLNAGLTLGALPSTTGSQSIAYQGSWTIPVGVYWVNCDMASTLQVYVNGAWKKVISLSSSVNAAALAISDGTNVRITNDSGGGAITCYWRRLA